MDKFTLAIEALVPEFEKIEEVLVVYVYGSVARGDSSLRHSDLDLLVVVNSAKAGERLKKMIDRTIIPIGAKLGVKVHPEYQGINVRHEDRTLLAKMIEEGRIIFSRGVFSLDNQQLGLKAYLVYEFSSKESASKTMFSKVLHGRKSWYLKNGKKIEKDYKGIADNDGIISLGRGALLVRKDRQNDLEQTFRRFGVSFTLKKMVYG